MSSRGKRTELLGVEMEMEILLKYEKMKFHIVFSRPFIHCGEQGRTSLLVGVSKIPIVLFPTQSKDNNINKEKHREVGRIILFDMNSGINGGVNSIFIFL